MATQFDKFKLWIFPGLASIMGVMVLNTVTEIKSDLKFLLAQGTADHIRIDNLERVVYNKTIAALSASSNVPPKQDLPRSQELVATVPPNNKTIIRPTNKKKTT